MRFLFRRALHSLVLLIGASALSFLLANLAPGDFFDEMKLNPEISGDTLAGLRSQYGLDRPLAPRYLEWARSVLRGEWGFSFAYTSPARPIVLSRAGKTLVLTGAATLLAWLIALPLGAWAAARPESWVDWFTRGAVAVLLATPELVLGLWLLVFAVRTGYFPTGGLSSLESAGTSTWADVKDIARHVFLAAVC